VTAGVVRGRKKFQKIVFIAQQLGYPFGESFDLHVWGPYSEVVAMKLKEMTDWGFAREEVLPGPAGNHLYVYGPGPNAQAALVGAPDPDPTLPGLTRLVAHLNEQDATFLEGVATALYLRSKGFTDAEVSERLPRLKSDKFPDADRVETVLGFANQLNFFRSDG
jgi:uncharacterized protein YwgA